MRLCSLLALLALALPVAGCGGDDEDRLVVSAASSLRDAFASYGEAFDYAEIRFSFGGSDELAAQIRQGVRPDVFAAANTRLTQELFDAGFLERPSVFATNELVVAVPTDRETVIDDVGDLARDGVQLAVAAEGVPVGDYTRDVIARLGRDRGRRILANVRSEEPDVAGIVGKLTQGGADAGFVYITDVLGSSGRLRAVRLPAELQPAVEYGIAIVRGAANRAAAVRFVAGLRGGAGANALSDAGFVPAEP